MTTRARRAFAIACLLSVSTAAAEVRDGRLYDPGVARTAPAEGAPEALGKLAGMVGAWDVALEIRRPGQEPLESEGTARITYMNRGHGLMERTRVADFDGEGHAMATMTFYAVDRNGAWTASEGNSWTEAITVYSGGFEGESLVLHDAFRAGGGPALLMLRRTYAPKDEGAFEMRLETSTDLGKSWNAAVIRTYRPRAGAGEDFFPVRDDVGLPAPGRPEEAAQFDFLLGVFDADHWLRSPQGELRWRATSTAVHALDGHALLEFNWHDQDPTLRDAATTILRLYNRSMRRWESLFLNNRTHAPLHFGGVREGERIVLHPFGAQTGGNPLFQWIFYEPSEDAYRWKGLRSTDRGKTWPPYWTIELARRGAPQPGEPAEPAE